MPFNSDSQTSQRSHRRLSGQVSSITRLFRQRRKNSLSNCSQPLRICSNSSKYPDDKDESKIIIGEPKLKSNSVTTFSDSSKTSIRETFWKPARSVTVPAKCTAGSDKGSSLSNLIESVCEQPEQTPLPTIETTFALPLFSKSPSQGSDNVLSTQPPKKEHSNKLLPESATGLSQRSSLEEQFLENCTISDNQCVKLAPRSPVLFESHKNSAEPSLGCSPPATSEHPELKKGEESLSGCRNSQYWSSGSKEAIITTRNANYGNSVGHSTFEVPPDSSSDQSTLPTNTSENDEFIFEDIGGEEHNLNFYKNHSVSANDDEIEFITQGPQDSRKILRGLTQDSPRSTLKNNQLFNSKQQPIRRRNNDSLEHLGKAFSKIQNREDGYSLNSTTWIPNRLVSRASTWGSTMSRVGYNQIHSNDKNDLNGKKSSTSSFSDRLVMGRRLQYQDAKARHLQARERVHNAPKITGLPRFLPLQTNFSES